MEIEAYGKKIVFTNKEAEIFADCGLELDSEFLELILFWNDVTEFEENATSEEIHDNCIDAIKSYSDVVEKTISYMQKDELVWEKK